MFFKRWFARDNRKTTRSGWPRFVPYLEVLEKREVLSTLLVTTTADNGPGSLRAAITQSNADGGGDQIYFNIPGGGVQTIRLQSALPQITAPVTIDGYSQGALTPNNLATPNNLGAGQGTNANLSVQLTGVSSVTTGLDITFGSGTLIRGLSIFGFSNAGIVIEGGASGVQIAGDFLGTRANGDQAPSGNGVGVLISTILGANTIGGTADADRNLISGNAQQGVLLLHGGNTVENDLIGTTKLGNGSLANGQQGVLVEGNKNTIGGTSAEARNVISGNAGNGVEIFGPNNFQIRDNQVIGNYIGTDATGLIADANKQAGVLLNDTNSTIIRGNVIAANNPSKNAQYGGISINTLGGPLYSTSTQIAGNYIGVAADGVTALGNGYAGILVQDGYLTAIGGTTDAERNIIAGNQGDGIVIGPPSALTTVQGNYIGVVGPDGTTAQANTANGIRVASGDATIGGMAEGAGNIISGNSGAGVLVSSSGSAKIQGNYIGLGADGLTAVGNGKQGVFLDQDKGSTVGGTTAGAGNVISGNKAHAVDILHGNSNDVVQGNFIGTNAAGNGAVANGGVGVLVNGSSNVTIGGTADGAGNLISGNTGGGVDVSGSSKTVVAGNQIGTDETGELALGNGNYGVQIENSATGTTIGGTTENARNIISGNVSTTDSNGNQIGGSGVLIAQTAGSTVVQGNYIGTNQDGTAALGNNAAGVLVLANQVTIGGTASGAGNVISGNGGSNTNGVAGVLVSNVATAGVKIQGNFLGTNATGTATLGNQAYGVYLAKSNGVSVGGTETGAGNIISGNVTSGVFVGAGSGNQVAGNRIGTDVSGNNAVANGTTGDDGHDAGVMEAISSNLNISDNTISGNNGEGILLVAGSNIVIQSNTIGLNEAGTTALGNTNNGIYAEADSNDSTPVTNLTIGGSNSVVGSIDIGNILSGNKGAGIDLNGTDGATIEGNFIGTDNSGMVALGNSSDGIQLGGGDSNVAIGGTTPSQRNIISGNTSNGVNVQGSSATIQGNFIGLGVDGNTKIANRKYGVLLASDDNTVGAGNVISGNWVVGVEIQGNNNLVTNNFIGTTADGTAAAGNNRGIDIDKSTGNTVQSNVISGNSREGVVIFFGSDNELLGNTIGLNASGTAALANERGVAIGGGSDNVVGATGGNGNVISGNNKEGVQVTNGASGTSLMANYIGTTKDGFSAVGNGTAGVVVSSTAKNTTIGSTAGGGNVISGNDAAGADGVVVQDSATNTLIQGNNIGLDVFGSTVLANLHGIVIRDEAANTTVSRNFIGFNTLSGIDVTGSPTNTSIQGNYVGLNADGRATPNLKDGILVQGGSGTNISGNTVSGNNGNGIEFSGSGITGDNTVSDNRIGTNSNGTTAIGNGMAGVLVDNLTAPVHSLSILNNTISGNADEGVFITASNQVSLGGNVIGLNKLGTVALANGTSGSFDGVHVTDSSDVVIGGTTASGDVIPGNVISGNTRDGIRVDGGSTQTLIASDTIGLLKGGLQAAANAGNGINITGNANGTTIGGTDADSANVISGNAKNGINIDATTATTTVNSNIVGLNATQTAALGNGGDGIHVLGAGVTIVGNLQGTNSAIAGNKGNGILVSGANASSTLIQGFRIGTNGSTPFANALDGILVTASANNVLIGGTVENDENTVGNLISGNTRNGIEMNGVSDAQMLNNLVGTDLAGQKALGNGLTGIALQGTTSAIITGNTVSANGQGGIVAGDAASTLISSNNIGTTSGFGLEPLGNSGDGIFVTGVSSDTTIDKNLIAANSGNGVEFGVNATGLTLTGNTISPAQNYISGGNETGVLVSGQNVTIGGTTADQANSIYGNSTTGIDVEGTAGNVAIQGNYIGTSVGNLGNGGNGADGIFVQGLARNVTIGGTTAGASNVISGNKGNGIHLRNVTQTVQILGNQIGTGGQSTFALGNAQDGILLEASGNALIQSNTISANGTNGVELVNGSNDNTLTVNMIGVKANGTTALGNLGFGVWVHQGSGAASSNNIIGGTAAGAGNVIGFNKEGVVIGDSLTDNSQQNAIEGNSIFESSTLIDLGDTGGSYTPSGTSGPNLLEVSPTLTSATVSGSDLTLNGLLNGTLPDTTYRIEFFAAQSIFGPFKKFLGFTNVTTNGSGNVPGGFSAVLTNVAVPEGTKVSATATDQNGNTTGFAAAITTAPPRPLQSLPPTQSPTSPPTPPSSSPTSSSAPTLSPTQVVVDVALETAAFLLQDNLPALLNLEAFSMSFLGESLPPSSELLSSILSDLSEFGSAAFLGLQLGLDIAVSVNGATK